VKRHHRFSSILGSGILTGMAAIAASVQPAQAAATQITNVQVNPKDGGMEVVLQTQNGERPQVFTVNRGNTLVADLVNTQLQLPTGNGFLQNNPAPGISSITVAQLDANSVRVTVSGGADAPSGQVNQSNSGLVLSVNPAGGAAAQTSQPTASTTAPTAPAPTTVAQSPAPAPAPAAPAPTTVAQAPAPAPAAPAVPPPPTSAPLVPNPQITIDGVPVVQASQTGVPPLLPRAIAPPVGDIAVGSVDVAASEIQLGTTEVVPRLVLRDAPAREVLSLLARAAGLNVAYIDDGAAGQQQAQAGQQGQETAPQDVRVSLDIENEPVQNVFNYVLRIANLQANRSGRTVFVGRSLPNSARQVISRTLRLNQVPIPSALNFLVGLGAETAVSRERQVASVVAIPLANVSADGGGQQASGVNQVQTTTEQRLEVQRVDFQDSTPILRGLQVIGDERTSSVTMVGTPRQIEIAAAQLTQLDIRRRQVAVNVKIVDVNLLATENINTSFSFGVGDTFVVSDGGTGFVNYGGFNPPSAATASGSVISSPVIQNPLVGLGANTIVDLSSPGVRVPGTTPGTVIVDQRPGQTPIRRISNAAAGEFLRRVAGVSENPFETGITDISQAEDNIITIDADGNATVTQGTLGTATAGLPSLFQYPTRFLANLQAQVTNGNAKILTDPTLVVQEGQTANVVLGQDVVTNASITQNTTNAGTSQSQDIEKEIAGLSLALEVNRIDDNGFVTLQINPQVTSPADTQVINNTQITLLARRNLQSGQVRLRDGQTLILSGIIQETDRTTVSKVPILGDIPILGALFRRTDRNNSRQEVIVLLTPRVLDDSDFSTFGYRYTPSPEAQELLQRQGVQVP
jgi:type IV pilus assembly protein PilQ